MIALILIALVARFCHEGDKLYWCFPVKMLLTHRQNQSLTGPASSIVMLTAANKGEPGKEKEEHLSHRKDRDPPFKDLPEGTTNSLKVNGCSSHLRFFSNQLKLQKNTLWVESSTPWNKITRNITEKPQLRCSLAAQFLTLIPWKGKIEKESGFTKQNWNNRIDSILGGDRSSPHRRGSSCWLTNPWVSGNWAHEGACRTLSHNETKFPAQKHQ